MISPDKVMLLAQLVEGLEQASKDLENAYNIQDKKKFDRAKAVISEYQNKISYLLNEVKQK